MAIVSAHTLLCEAKTQFQYFTIRTQSRQDGQGNLPFFTAFAPLRETEL
jgi:hypothetical protein